MKKLPELQKIANAACDYLRIHGGLWPEVVFLDVEGLLGGVDWHAGDSTGETTIELNPGVCKEKDVDIVLVLLHEVAHIYLEKQLRMRYYGEMLSLEMERWLYDLWKEGVF